MTRNGNDKERCAVIRVNADPSSHIYHRIVERVTGEFNNGYRDGVKKLSAITIVCGVAILRIKHRHNAEHSWVTEFAEMRSCL